MKCRFCNTVLEKVFLDLQKSPLANSFLTEKALKQKEPFFPLCTFICEKCFLVQVTDSERPENIFNTYAYFSSYSETWLNHVQNFVDLIIQKFSLNEKTLVIEIASNDGYLLQNFKGKNIPILGIEPASNIAIVAEEKGIPTIVNFFSLKLAEDLSNQGRMADCLIAFNVLPHVPNLNDFLRGLKILLKPNGIIIIQFSAYIISLIENNEFDMIYHEHFSYFSLYTIQKILTFHKLIVFDVERKQIHGGSLRLYVKHKENTSIPINPSVNELLNKEKEYGLMKIETYQNFQKKVDEIKHNICNFFIKAKKDGKKIVCYSAPAKGNTLLNYCELGSNIFEYIVDINPHKQGLYLPGTHIPIYAPSKIKETKPDYVVILAWNLKDEIMKQMSHIKEWGGKFVVLIPEIKILD